MLQVDAVILDHVDYRHWPSTLNNYVNS